MSCWSRLFGRRKKKPPVIPPAPDPIVEEPPAARPITSVGYTFCGWADPRPEFGAVPGVQCSVERPWEALLTDDRMPSQGYYDERDPAVTIERLRQCEEGRIDCVAYQIELAHEHTQTSMMPAYRPKLESPLINAHCADNHPESSVVKHFLSWWDVSVWDDLWKEMIANGWKASHAIESNRWFAHEIATRYMKRANYLAIEGRPVFMRGAADNLDVYRTRFGIEPADIVKAWREEIRAVTGADIYLIGVAVDPPARPKLKGWGFDALTEYLLHADGWQNTMEVYRWWWAKDLKDCRERGLDYLIPATAGYDGRAWNTPEFQRGVGHMPTPSQFTEHVREARALALDNYDITRGMVTLYAMTEFGEGGVIEAMQPGMIHDGDAMLRAHRAACL